MRNTEATEEPDYRSMHAVAERYAISYETVRKWVRTGRVPAIRVGRTVRVDVREVERLATIGHTT